MSALAAPDIDSPPLQRYGFPQWTTGVSPAAGAEYTETFPGQYFTRILSVAFLLTPDANAANRQVALEWRDDADVRVMFTGPVVTVPASDATNFVFDVWRDQDAWEVSSTVLARMPPIIVPPTYDFTIKVENIQAGDTLTKIRILREVFFTSGQPPGA